MKRLIVAGLGLSANLLMAAGAAAAPGAEELERWFESDDPAPPSGDSVEDVNGGSLDFLENRPQRPVHHHQNALAIHASSLRDGWVRLSQCHHNLDPVSRVEITFREGRVRDLSVRETRNIGSALVEGPSVQLEDVQPGASLCLEAWTRALRRKEDGTYSLRSGPFMRKFLDGYYPMRVSMTIDYRAAGLDPVAISPLAQDGFRVEHGAGELSFDAWFEGRLVTEVTFDESPL